MSDTFSLKFFLEGKDIGLKMTWVEKDKTVILPTHLWPTDSDHLLEVAEIAFPRFQLKRRAAIGRQKREEAELKRALVKAGAIVKKIRVTSRSTGKQYEIKVLGKRLTCSCPDFVFRKRKSGQHCKHIAEWIKTRRGKETYEKINPPKVRRKGGKLRLRDMTLEQIEFAHKHRFELQRIVDEHRIRQWLKEISSSTTKETSTSSSESKGSPISLAGSGLKLRLRKKQKS